MTDPLDALLKEADDYVARGYYTSPERYAAAIRELRADKAALVKTCSDMAKRRDEGDALWKKTEAERDSLLERNNRLLRDNGALIAEVSSLTTERDKLSNDLAAIEHSERVRQRLAAALGAKPA